MEKPVVTVDLDGVVFDFVRPMIVRVNNTYNTSYTFEDAAHYNLAAAFHLPQEEIDILVEQVVFEDSLPFVHGAVEGLEKLAGDYSPVYVTSRRYTWKDPTEKALSRLPALCKGQLCFTSKEGFPLDGYKGSILLQLGSKLHLEDGLHFAREVAEKGIPVILFDQPWNQRHRPYFNVHRVGCYKEQKYWDDVPALAQRLLFKQS
ncbi:MAG TPA: hypothetical protein VJJ75_03010 [Candidatus Nanoarchaeia archaeon]|nr:hypothetical protein [Candidatus Nanoarchaeia archaeon]